MALILKTIPATRNIRPLFPCVLSSCMLLYLLLPPHHPMGWVIWRWKVQTSGFVKFNVKHWLNLLSKLKGNCNCPLSKCQLIVSFPHFVSALKLLSQTPSFAVLLHVPLLLPSLFPSRLNHWVYKMEELIACTSVWRVLWFVFLIRCIASSLS